ncbi:MAG: hypothetical protein KHW47_01460, partial [Actinotignum schaalii]|nr:hypothetical protein [Actinotignum schaalii]
MSTTVDMSAAGFAHIGFGDIALNDITRHYPQFSIALYSVVPYSCYRIVPFSSEPPFDQGPRRLL